MTEQFSLPLAESAIEELATLFPTASGRDIYFVLFVNLLPFLG